jgi:preprotein translocase subunit SecE
MADNEKNIAPASDVEQTATDEKGAAAKVAKAAKGNKKSDKPGFFARSGKSTKKFFKDFRGEVKKIVWPDAKMVLKSTGVVLLVVAILSIIIYGIDQGLSAGITGLKKLATNDTSVTETVDDETAEATDADAEAAADEESEENADASEKETEEAEADTQAAEEAAEENTAD